MSNDVTGWDVDVEIDGGWVNGVNLFRIVNAREGLDRKADNCQRNFQGLGGAGHTAGIALTHEELNR